MQINSFGCNQTSPVTCGNDHGNHICFSVHPHLVHFIVLPFYYVMCVHISKMVLTERNNHFLIEAHDN